VRHSDLGGEVFEACARIELATERPTHERTTDRQTYERVRDQLREQIGLQAVGEKGEAETTVASPTGTVEGCNVQFTGMAA